MRCSLKYVTNPNMVGTANSMKAIVNGLIEDINAFFEIFMVARDKLKKAQILIQRTENRKVDMYVLS